MLGELLDGVAQVLAVVYMAVGTGILIGVGLCWLSLRNNPQVWP